jgi:hypothetical protein
MVVMTTRMWPIHSYRRNKTRCVIGSYHWPTDKTHRNPPFEAVYAEDKRDWRNCCNSGRRRAWGEGWRVAKGMAFFNIETLLSLLFYFLIGERITEKEGLETFIGKDYKVYMIRHYITSKPFYHSLVYASNAQTTWMPWIFVTCKTWNMFLWVISAGHVHSSVLTLLKQWLPHWPPAAMSKINSPFLPTQCIHTISWFSKWKENNSLEYSVVSFYTANAELNSAVGYNELTVSSTC